MILFPLAALAKDDGQANATFPGYVMDEVVVSASRVEEPMRQVPHNVTVITREEIERSGGNSITDLLARQVGVSQQNDFGTDRNSLVGLRRQGNLASQNVLVMVDGQRITPVDMAAAPLNTVPLSEVERIEIVRGPGGVIYGDRAVGGVINIITRKGDAANGFSGSVGAGYGSYDSTKYNAAVRGREGSVFPWCSWPPELLRNCSAPCVPWAVPWGSRTGPKHRQRARGVAYLPQSLPGTLPLTVRELVLLGRTAHQGLLGLETRADREAVDRALDLAQVVHLADARLERLSGGELQRAFIAKALRQEPAILLLDEPTASLDPAHALQVMKLLAGLSEVQGVCTVMASHDLNLAARYADEATLLHAGRVACQGAPAVVFSPQRLEPVYGCGFELCPSSSGSGMLLPFPSENIPRQD